MKGDVNLRFLPQNSAEWMLASLLLMIIVLGFGVGIGNEHAWKKESLTRARVARVKHDLKSVGSTLGADFKKSSSGGAYWGPLKYKRVGAGPDQSYQLRDPFNTDPKNGMAYQYYSNGSDFYALISRGPDGVLDLTSRTLGKISTLELPGTREAALAQFRYDPTNGTVSTGDIWSIKD